MYVKKSIFYMIGKNNETFNEKQRLKIKKSSMKKLHKKGAQKRCTKSCTKSCMKSCTRMCIKSCTQSWLKSWLKSWTKCCTKKCAESCTKQWEKRFGPSQSRTLLSTPAPAPAKQNILSVFLARIYFLSVKYLCKEQQKINRFYFLLKKMYIFLILFKIHYQIFFLILRHFTLTFSEQFPESHNLFLIIIPGCNSDPGQIWWPRPQWYSNSGRCIVHTISTQYSTPFLFTLYFEATLEFG